MVKIISVQNGMVVSTESNAVTGYQVIEQILKQQSETGCTTHAAVYDESGDFYFMHAHDDMDTTQTSDYIFD